MKAPDKIFMPNELLSEEWQRHIEGEDTAYIRKDALISFLEKEKDDLYNWHFQDEDRKFKVYEEVIDKIKEL